MPHATVSFDPQTLTLEATLPQAALVVQSRGRVGPSLWNYGGGGAFIGYTLNVHENSRRRDGWLGLTAGGNLGAWRYRHHGSVQTVREGRTAYTSLSHTLQRTLPALESELLIGEGYTDGRLFEAVRFAGVQLISDERMLPDGMDGYAPVVRGIAPSPAKVTIRQNGAVLRELTVAPGPFEVTDLAPGMYGGALDVTVTDAEGRTQHFTVHTAAVPQALRAGAWRHAISVGRLREPRAEGHGQDTGSAPSFLEASVATGVNNALTVLAGGRASADYLAILAGAAITTPLGAFGADMTVSRASLGGSAAGRGSSVRLSYQRSFISTGTHVGLATVRHGSRHFVTLVDAVRRRGGQETASSDGAQRPRQQVQIFLSQRIDERNALIASGGHTGYRGGLPALTDYQVGLQRHLGRGHVDVSAQRTRQGDRSDDSVQLRYSIPLGTSLRRSVAASSATGPHGGSARLDLHGSNGGDPAWSYAAGAGRTPSGTMDYNATASVRTAASDLSALAAWSEDAGRTVAATASGAFIFHSGGVNTSATVPDGFVLVAAPGAIGARTGNGAVRVARNGYAVIPGMTPFRWNDVSLDVTGLSHDVVLAQNSQRVAPAAGAMVTLRFETQTQKMVYIRAVMPADAGRPVFGSDVRNAYGEVVGSVGQGGLLAVKGEHERVWVAAGPGYCALDYTLPPLDPRGMRITEAICQPVPAVPAASSAAASRRALPDVWPVVPPPVPPPPAAPTWPLDVSVPRLPSADDAGSTPPTFQDIVL